MLPNKDNAKLSSSRLLNNSNYNIITNTPKKPNDDKDTKISYYGNTAIIGGASNLTSSLQNNKYNNIKNSIFGTPTTSTQDYFGNSYNISSNPVDQDRIKFISSEKKIDHPGTFNSIINNVTYGRANMNTIKQTVGGYDYQNSNMNNNPYNNNINNNNNQKSYGNYLQSNGNSNIPTDKINMSKPNESPYYEPSSIHKQNSGIMNQAKSMQGPSGMNNLPNTIKSYPSSNEGGYKSTNYTDPSSSIANSNSSLINRFSLNSNIQNKK